MGPPPPQRQASSGVRVCGEVVGGAQFWSLLSHFLDKGLRKVPSLIAKGNKALCTHSVHTVCAGDTGDV